jgi:hypothetical protein
MSRLDDAVVALKAAVGDRPFALVVDLCAPSGPRYRLRIEENVNASPYAAWGLFRAAALRAEANLAEHVSEMVPNDEPDDPEDVEPEVP